MTCCVAHARLIVPACRFVHLKWEHLKQVLHEFVKLKGDVGAYAKIYDQSLMNYLVRARGSCH